MSQPVGAADRGGVAGAGPILLLGGTSDIGLAIATELAAQGASRVGGQGQREVILAARPTSPRLPAAVARMTAAGALVRVVNFDALDPAGHPETIRQAGEFTVAIVAFGLLGDADTWRNQAEAVQLAGTNYTAAVSVGVLIGQALAGRGGGTIIAVSSMAGEKVRRSNFVYGSSKAGMDAFYRHLGEALAPDLVRVLVVRPGFVTSTMTAGRGRVPLSVTPERVAKDTVRALRRGARLVRVPAIFGPLTLIFKHLPSSLVRRLHF